jgi:hypothetical protein
MDIYMKIVDVKEYQEEIIIAGILSDNVQVKILATPLQTGVQHKIMLQTKELDTQVDYSGHTPITKERILNLIKALGNGSKTVMFANKFTTKPTIIKVDGSLFKEAIKKYTKLNGGFLKLQQLVFQDLIQFGF